ncbi:MAG: formylglycine-generating enzyme family protein [Treponema sp.]|nr:formylglycine-generating enzyme family protein [Treponema sp.]
MKKREVISWGLLAALLVIGCPNDGGNGYSRVTIAAIPGVTPPATGQAPATTIAGTAQYTGTVSWSPPVTGTFAPSTAYRATITLSANPGFTFADVAADFFTVEGAASVGNNKNSRVVNATFPATGSNPLENTIIDMAWVSGGTFTMGGPSSEPSSYGDEHPRHQVTLSGFWMGKYEVTQEQYEEVMGTNLSYFTTAVDGENPARRPVEGVDWYDAVEFCNRLSEKEGLTPYYIIDKNTRDPNWVPQRDVDEDYYYDSDYYYYGIWQVTRNTSANGYRLPTEAQWEYACRAGTTTPFNFHNGTSWGTKQITTDQANFDGTSNLYNGSPAGVYRARTMPVGSFAPNAWGLYDMHGNVAEWCWDWYGYGAYSSAAQADPSGPVSGSYRVSRGGSWYDNGQYLRSAWRDYDGSPSYGYGSFGVRLVRP